MRESDLVVFVGPSVPAAELRRLHPCRCLPPARQGDVWRALEGRPRAILLIDGVFELQPSVWHRELVAALESGVAVFGAASMGALRAAELDSLGMVGVGQIYRWYRDRVLVDDSEVALLHADAEHRFRPLTLPLVNVRHAAGQAREEGVLSAREAAALVEAAAAIFYQERRWPAVLERIARRWRASTRVRWERWAQREPEDLKRKDALEGMTAVAGFLKAGLAPPPIRGVPRPSALVRAVHPSTALARALRQAKPEKAEELSQDGLRTLLLSAWARSMGVTAERGRGAEALTRGPGAFHLDHADAVRHAEDRALERWLLEHAQRWVADGPSFAEGVRWAGHLASPASNRRGRGREF